jgi:hypothetical protein
MLLPWKPATSSHFCTVDDGRVDIVSLGIVSQAIFATTYEIID